MPRASLETCSKLSTGLLPVRSSSKTTPQTAESTLAKCYARHTPRAIRTNSDLQKLLQGPPGQRDREVLEAIREHQPLFRINTLLHVEHSNIRDLDDAENRRRSSYSAAIALNSSFRPPMRRVSPGGEYSGFLQVAVRVGVD